LTTGDNVDETTHNFKKRYRKNKHFFIDPFQLTIAQWCYVHGFQRQEPYYRIGEDEGSDDIIDLDVQETTPTSKDFARKYLASDSKNVVGGIGAKNFAEMERSYWKYLYTWERDEWNELLS
jgi:hypothetical protein